MKAQYDVVIVGSGLAGYLLAMELRKFDTTCSVCVISKHPGYFYSKPMLSAALSQGKQADDLVTKTMPEMIDTHQIHVFDEHAVQSMDTDRRTVTLDSGDVIGYDYCVLATGSRVKTLPCPHNEGVIQVNHLEDYRLWRDQVQQSQQVALIGSGLIGVEFAHDLAVSGYKCQLYSMESWPLAQLLPPLAGNALLSAFNNLGIHWYGSTKVRSCHHVDNQWEIKHDDAMHRADHVLAAIGIEPEMTLAKEAGLTCDDGIMVNAYGQSSDPHVYALGDCANVEGLHLCYVAPIRRCIDAMKHTLRGTPTKIQYPAMPVMVKTPTCPVCVVAPQLLGKGNIRWEEDGNETSVVSRAYQEDQLVGFALVGKASQVMRAELMKSLSPWL